MMTIKIKIDKETMEQLEKVCSKAKVVLKNDFPSSAASEKIAKEIFSDFCNSDINNTRVNIAEKEYGDPCDAIRDVVACDIEDLINSFDEDKKEVKGKSETEIISELKSEIASLKEKNRKLKRQLKKFRSK